MIFAVTLIQINCRHFCVKIQIIMDLLYVSVTLNLFNYYGPLSKCQELHKIYHCPLQKIPEKCNKSFRIKPYFALTFKAFKLKAQLLHTLSKQMKNVLKAPLQPSIFFYKLIFGLGHIKNIFLLGMHTNTRHLTLTKQLERMDF